MKPLFKYYGGKQRLSHRIVKMMPDHKTYCEPFAGAASVLLQKPIKEREKDKDSGEYREVLNDINDYLLSFYKVLQDEESVMRLAYRLMFTPYSRQQKRETVYMYRDDTAKDDVEKAWLVVTGLAQSYIGGLNLTSWGAPVRVYDPAIRRFRNSVDNVFVLADRLSEVYLESLKGDKCIANWDSDDTLFFVDPPYADTQNRPYIEGYSIEDYQNLINQLSNIKGKFILTSYMNNEVTIPDDWHIIDVRTKITVGRSYKSDSKERLECIFCNFNPVTVEKYIDIVGKAA